MNFVDELCSLHNYIKEHFENVEFISAGAPDNDWNREKAVVCFTSNGRNYKYAISDETEEEKAE